MSQRKISLGKVYKHHLGRPVFKLIIKQQQQQLLLETMSATTMPATTQVKLTGAAKEAAIMQEIRALQKPTAPAVALFNFLGSFFNVGFKN